VIFDQRLDDVFHTYGNNIASFARAVFSQKKLTPVNQNENCNEHTERRIAHAERRLERAEMRLQHHIERTERRGCCQATNHIEHVKNEPQSQVKGAYYCSNCGHAFTQKMVSLLQNRELIYCEYCGQRFNIRNETPVPQESH
jgi:DNA-directed RNA polymerase subunit RPC12/RpoP